MTTLELNDREMMALLLLLKLGMDTYTGEPVDDAVEGLAQMSNAVLDRLIAKVSLAGGRAAAAAHEGEA